VEGGGLGGDGGGRNLRGGLVEGKKAQGQAKRDGGSCELAMRWVDGVNDDEMSGTITVPAMNSTRRIGRNSNNNCARKFVTNIFQ